MAQHDVKVRAPELTVTGSDFEFHVTRDGEKFGTLRVSKGNVQWVPVNWRRARKLSWKQFDEVMKEEGSRIPVKTRAQRSRRTTT